LKTLEKSRATIKVKKIEDQSRTHGAQSDKCSSSVIVLYIYRKPDWQFDMQFVELKNKFSCSISAPGVSRGVSDMGRKEGGIMSLRDKKDYSFQHVGNILKTRS